VLIAFVQRLEAPDEAAPALRNLVTALSEYEPDARPDFAEIVKGAIVRTEHE
jgi:hypothetical protein